MKKTAHVNLISIRIVVLSLLFSIGFISEIRSETNTPGTLETKEIVRNVYSIKDDFVNLFLIKNNDKYIAVDAGTNLDVVSKELQKLKINPDKVVALFLTHTHYDHVAAIALFKNARIYVSKLELPTAKKEATFTLDKISYKNAYSLLEDQQTIQVNGTKVKSISTPGHTPGSMCYLINDGYLFVGDAFSLINGKVDKPNKDYSKDMKSAIQSFKKINKFSKASYLFTAHCGISSNYKNAVNTKLE